MEYLIMSDKTWNTFQKNLWQNVELENRIRQLDIWNNQLLNSQVKDTKYLLFWIKNNFVHWLKIEI